MAPENLSLQKDGKGEGSDSPSSRILALGEVLWDLLPTCNCLGGAPLNFAVHAERLGYEPLLVSAVGSDELGRKALRAVELLGVGTSMLQTTECFPTGTASVRLDHTGQPSFTIQRPAAYDAVRITASEIERLSAWAPAWFYYGTLFASTLEGKATLLRLLDAVPGAIRFYDVNLRPGFDCPGLVLELLGRSAVVKMNESELTTISRFSGLPAPMEEFCRAATERFGWSAVCVTLGARGCAILKDGEYVAADAYPVAVADSVGAGDAFAAAFLHGIASDWPVLQVAEFANRVAAVVASRVGAIPEWSVAEAINL